MRPDGQSSQQTFPPPLPSAPIRPSCATSGSLLRRRCCAEGRRGWGVARARTLSVGGAHGTDSVGRFRAGRVSPPRPTLWAEAVGGLGARPTLAAAPPPSSPSTAGGYRSAVAARPRPYILPPAHSERVCSVSSAGRHTYDIFRHLPSAPASRPRPSTHPTTLRRLYMPSCFPLPLPLGLAEPTRSAPPESSPALPLSVLSLPTSHSHPLRSPTMATLPSFLFPMTPLAASNLGDRLASPSKGKGRALTPPPLPPSPPPSPRRTSLSRAPRTGRATPC